MGIENTDKTVTVLLEQMEEGQQKREMEASVSRLIDYIVQIREVEQLNKELIQQSMTFVQLSLEMLQPNLGKMNYGKQQSSHMTPNTSVFDSKHKGDYYEYFSRFRNVKTCPVCTARGSIYNWA